MSKTPLISVIVPVFQCESTIKRCLLSIINQTIQNIEIIVIYKYSIDNTYQEIKAINDHRIRIIEQKENSGPGGARNLGIFAAQGEYIGFVEADDVIDKDFYENLYNEVTSHVADVAFSNSTSNGKKLLYHNGRIILSNFIDKINYFVNGASFDKVFKTSLLKDNNIFFSEYLRWEDNPFIVKVAFFSEKIITVPGVCYHYSPSKWSDEYRERLRRDVTPIFYEIIDFIRDKSLSPYAKDSLLKFMMRSFIGGFLADKQIYRTITEHFGFSFSLFLRHHKLKVRRWRRSMKKTILGVCAHG